VWKTDDGSVFDTKEEAVKWEEYMSNKTNFSDFLEQNCMCLDYRSAIEVATTILAFYNVEPK
jgi:hypothetical protein